MLGEVEQRILECFQNGGGVPYSAFARFQHLMAEGSRANAHATLLDTTLPLIPGMIERLRDGVDVADIGCGQGYAINLMAQAFPQSEFTGYDFSEEAVAVGKANAGHMGLSNAHFEVKDVSKLKVSGRFDLITAFDAIHDQAKPATVLREVANALRPGGAFLMVDIAASSRLEDNVDHTFGPWLYTISCMHCITVSLGLDGEALGAMWGEQQARQMLDDAGFTKVEVKQIETDQFNSYYIAAKS
jgi:2-polyprenyl-3-methyl-5-hydroxy-6-metoxy-1,4-benzoquinol methylase